MSKKYLSLFLCTFLISTISSKAQDAEVTIQIDKLSEDVHMLTGQGGNIGIYVGERQVYMIDDQFGRLSSKIKAAIKTITDKPISVLLNTHMHGDHTGGNANFNTENTTVVAHDNVRTRMQTNLQKDLDDNKIDAEHYAKMLPEVTFSDDITFHDDDETIMVFHVHNAHTDGDVMIYFLKNNVIHMGDTYFAGRFPYMDLNSGGNANGYINAHKKALMVINDETKIIPGHGSVSNKKELEIYVKMLEDLKAKVQSEIDAGKTLEEVQSKTSITDPYNATHGNGFINSERILEIFYKSLKK
ncbi:glyoxylase-like metal-dependent hydrolase (beta-lactamase superfamily II) [Saonia flava]|uniref:Glyoxylase-like metal-dependent hydrolase (Beta-lactamase superfamily II) n=1 Tax=Saonia flava TaxID=523696 RepID=A0A846QUR5_9FLAO|nr:MBL fold metallo-hydrolase [Saonia flava]NJB70947.1 glyoxylase-like metal-dependent hydrolase (beta-lactamase superfamily II) [Saonia flava]